MKKLLKTFTFIILPITSLIIFICIGKINEKQIVLQQLKPTMSGSIASAAWNLRGICVAILIFLYSFVLYSRISKARKLFVLLLLLMINIPLMNLMEIAVYMPLSLLIVLILNIFAFIPALIRTNV